MFIVSRATRISTIVVLFSAQGCSLGEFGLAETSGQAAGTKADAGGALGPSTHDASLGPTKGDGAIGSGQGDGSDDSSDAGEPDTQYDGNIADSASVHDATIDAGPLPPVLGTWSFNEGLGFSSQDLSGNGHTAMFVGGARWGIGKDSLGLTLDGVTGYADIGVPLVNTSKSFSVIAWVQLASVNTWETALSEDAINGSLFSLKLRGDGTQTFDFDLETSDNYSPGYVVAQSTSTARAQEWVHLASVYDASGKSGAKLYVNGVLESFAVAQPVLAATSRFIMGRGLYNGSTGSYFNGTIDEVSVYDGALSEAQVEELYQVYK